MSYALYFAGGHANAGLTYNLRNTGRSPAVAVDVRAKLFPISLLRYLPDQHREIENAFCERFRTQQDQAVKHSLFPGDKIPGNDNVLPLYPKDIDEGRKRSEGRDFRKGYVPVALIICVDYQFSFAPEHHQTRYAFQFVTPINGGVFDDFKPEGRYPDAKLLYLSQSAD